MNITPVQLPILRERIAQRKQELEAEDERPLQRKAAACLVGGAVASMATGAILAATVPSASLDLACCAGTLVAAGVGVGLADRAMRGVQDKTMLGLGLGAGMMSGFFFALGCSSGNHVAMAVSAVAGVAVSALVARGLHSSQNGLPERLNRLQATVEKFEQMEQLRQKLGGECTPA